MHNVLRSLSAIALAAACGGSASAPPAEISIDVPATALTGSSTAAIVVHASGAGDIALTVSGQPPGATAVFDKSHVQAGETATLTADPGTAAGGIYTLVILATAGSTSRGANLTWTFSKPGCTADTWANYSGSLFVQNCAGCHPGYADYSVVQTQATKVAANIQSVQMPPPGYPTLTVDDRTRIETWLKCGLPQ